MLDWLHLTEKNVRYCSQMKKSQIIYTGLTAFLAPSDCQSMRYTCPEREEYILTILVGDLRGPQHACHDLVFQSRPP